MSIARIVGRWIGGPNVSRSASVRSAAVGSVSRWPWVGFGHRGTLMAATKLERRVKALEGEVAKLKQHVTARPPMIPWWERIYGSFANDPAHEEAMRLGREYRESLRP